MKKAFVFVAVCDHGGAEDERFFRDEPWFITEKPRGAVSLHEKASRISRELRLGFMRTKVWKKSTCSVCRGVLVRGPGRNGIHMLTCINCLYQGRWVQ